MILQASGNKSMTPNPTSPLFSHTQCESTWLAGTWKGYTAENQRVGETRGKTRIGWSDVEVGPKNPGVF